MVARDGVGAHCVEQVMLRSPQVKESRNRCDKNSVYVYTIDVAVRAEFS